MSVGKEREKYDTCILGQKLEDEILKIHPRNIIIGISKWFACLFF